MPTYSTVFISEYTTDQMYDLVADVERYCEFLPWCKESKIIDHFPQGVIAQLMISFGAWKYSYTSRVELDRHNKEISVTLVQGPFRHLYNGWKFTPQQHNGSLIEFDIDFSLRSRMFEVIVKGFFKQAVNEMVEAFKKRAELLYQKKLKY